MKKYGKLIENQLEYAPKNKGSILNYYLNEEKLIEDGYKPVVFGDVPQGQYTISYRESNDSIFVDYVSVVIDEVQDLENLFNSQFIQTRYGWFRLDPKGFANAQQAIDFADKMIEKAGTVTPQIASLILFYDKPNFNNSDESSEEWLLSHQHSLPLISKDEWDAFYMEFGQAYLNKMYK